MANSQAQQNQSARKQPKFILGKLFTDAPVRKEPVEPQKILVAGLAEARPVKEYPDTFFGRAMKVMRGEFSTLFKSSVSMILFILPFMLIAVWLAGYFQNTVLGGLYNFMGNIGVGFPGVADSVGLSDARLYWDVKEPIACMVAASLIIMSIGAAGVFYCAKRSYFQDYYKRSFKTFWMGVAKHWWRFLLTAAIETLIGLALVTSVMYYLQQQALGALDAGAYCAVIFSWIFGAPLMMVPVVMMGLHTVYELNYFQTLKNAIVIIFNNPFSTIAVSLLSAIPVALLAAGRIMAAIDAVVMALVGFSFMALCWIALVHRGTVKCQLKKAELDKIALQQQRIEAKQLAKQNNAPKKQKQQPKPYQNPKKKKKK